MGGLAAWMTRGLIPAACAAVLLIGAVGCGGTPTREVRLAGAQVAVDFVGGWLEEAEQPRFRVERVKPVLLSQHGFEALANGRADLACTDRRLSDRERAQFAERGVALRGWRIAFYGYALYVHPDNPLDSVFAGHLSMLYQNQISDWHELGAGEGPIRLIGPRKATRGGQILAAQAKIFVADAPWEVRDSDWEIVQSVAADPLALGFASIGFDQGVRYLGLKMNRYEDPAFPSLEEIEREEYGLAKVLYVYVRADEPSAVAQRAVAWLRSPAAGEAMRAVRVWQMPGERAALEAGQ